MGYYGNIVMECSWCRAWEHSVTGLRDVDGVGLCDACAKTASYQISEPARSPITNCLAPWGRLEEKPDSDNDDAHYVRDLDSDDSGYMAIFEDGIQTKESIAADDKDNAAEIIS